MQFLKLLWEHFWGWIDWHGRLATVLLIVVSLGGAALINKASAIWANVGGVYLWLITTLAFVVFIDGILKAAEKLNPQGRTKRNAILDLTLTPSSGPSDKMLLGVMNNEKVQKFHAQCTTLDRRNDPNRLFRKTYDLVWEGHKDREAHIVHEESRNLLIATADENFQYQSQEVTLIEWLGDGSKNKVEYSRWTRNKAGPEYDLEVSVFGEGDNNPHVERYTLRCGGKICALEMITLQS